MDTQGADTHETTQRMRIIARDRRGREPDGRDEKIVLLTRAWDEAIEELERRRPARAA